MLSCWDDDDDDAVTEEMVEIEQVDATVPPVIMIENKEVDLHNPPPLNRRSSQMKMSYSEGALANTLAATGEGYVRVSDSGSYEILELDDLDFPDQGNSALSKLKRRMANLAIPNLPSSSAASDARQRYLKDLARTNILRSQLRFKEMKTRIILL